MSCTGGAKPHLLELQKLLAVAKLCTVVCIVECLHARPHQRLQCCVDAAIADQVLQDDAFVAPLSHHRTKLGRCTKEDRGCFPI